MSLSSAFTFFLLPVTRNLALARILALSATPPPLAHFLIC